MVERNWTTRTPEPGETIVGHGIVVCCRRQDGATLVSGNLEAAISEFAPSAPILGLMEVIPAAPFALRIARDRALLCTKKPLSIEGWHHDFAASAADDLFLEFTITGHRAPEVAACCMSAQPGSPSTSTLFAGVGALVAGLPDGFSLRVQTPDAAAVWAHLSKVIEGHCQVVGGYVLD